MHLNCCKRPFFLLFLLFLLIGCQQLDSTRFANEQTGGVIRLRGGQPRTLDPALTLSGPDSALGHVFTGLVMLDQQLQVQPELAAGWDVSADGLTYTFYLRQNARFHNGRPLTAADFIFSWERAADPALGSDTVLTYLGDIAGVAAVASGQANHISGLQALDEHTLQVQLTAPVVYFLAKLAYPVAFVVDEENVAQADWEHSPNGTGPFRLDTWRDDEIIVLNRNDDYYLPPPAVAQLVYDLGPGLPLAQYETGELALVGIGGANLERVQDPNNPLHADLRTGISLCTSSIGFNTRIPPFDDRRVRQAFSYALDKARLIESFANGNALPAGGPLPPGMPGYSGPAGYPFAPDAARRLLAEAGYATPADLPPLTYSTLGFDDVSGYTTAVITLWQETLGITITPDLIDPFIYYDQLYSGNVGNLYAGGWCADYPDPQNFLDILYHSDSAQNIGGFADAQIDARLEQARTERDVATRLALYAEIEADLVTAAPVVWVSHSLTAVLVKPSLQGYVLTPLGVPQWHRVSLINE